MRLGVVLVPAVVANVVVWWIYLADADRGFPWPAFVTLGSVIALGMQYQRTRLAPGAGRQRNRDRNRNRR